MLAQRLAAAQHLALRGTVVEQPGLTVVQVRSAGRAHERADRVVVLHDQAALYGEGVQERTGDQLESGVRIRFARDRATHLQERVAPRAREPRGAPRDVAARTAAVPAVSVPARGAAARGAAARGTVTPVPAAFAALEEALQVTRQEPPLPAGRPAAGNDTRVGPASQGVLTHLKHLGCGRYAQPAAAAARPPHLSL